VQVSSFFVVIFPVLFSTLQWEEEQISTKTDVYAFGCLLIELFSEPHARPWTGSKNMAIGRKVTSGKAPPELGSVQPAGVADLIRDCLKLDMSERPTMASVQERLVQLALEQGLSISQLAIKFAGSGSGSGSGLGSSPGKNGDRGGSDGGSRARVINKSSLRYRDSNSPDRSGRRESPRQSRSHKEMAKTGDPRPRFKPTGNKKKKNKAKKTKGSSVSAVFPSELRTSRGESSDRKKSISTDSLRSRKGARDKSRSQRSTKSKYGKPSADVIRKREKILKDLGYM
jgi:hypothetical protein